MGDRELQEAVKNKTITVKEVKNRLLVNPCMTHWHDQLGEEVVLKKDPVRSVYCSIGKCIKVYIMIFEILEFCDFN